MTLAVLVMLPAFAAASHRGTSRIPVCSALSRTAIANLVGTGPLTLIKKIGNECTFTGDKHGHYKPAFSVQLVPWSRTLFSLAEHDSMRSAAAEHAQFGVVSRALKETFRGMCLEALSASATLPAFSATCLSGPGP